MNGKTRRVNGVDLSSKSFAYVGDESDTSTWCLPVWIPGDEQRSLSAVKGSMGQFDSAKIPDCEKQRAFDTVRGALLAHGIKTDRRTFAPTNEAPTPAAEPAPPVTVKQQTVEVTDPDVLAAIARADYRATEILRSLGLE